MTGNQGRIDPERKPKRSSRRGGFVKVIHAGRSEVGGEIGEDACN